LVDIFRDVAHQFEHIAYRFAESGTDIRGVNRKLTIGGGIAEAIA
jgi:hypothetical protein